VMREVGIIQK